MNTQEFLVYIIIACTVAVIVRYVYRQISGKSKGCNCHECPMHGGECHCNDTQK
ncbi:MAG: FeoB-associated Cys-rich membrane protein [Bacteroidaceae bacterium]|nr:FeoB-associated Cys-rich membrane protein [Bacteroidaceae bacterium]MBQ7460709.1 FeoB-associated Cys-rich membrane protein [Bacteroidaceae bacterium]